MTIRGRACAVLVLWFSLFVLLFFPWGDFQNHAHWYKVTWTSTQSLWLRAFDVAGNLAAFVPFGALMTVAVGRGRWWERPLTIGLALLLSLAAEAAQLFSHSRIPSITDIAANVAGAAVGTFLAWHRRYGRSAQL